MRTPSLDLLNRAMQAYTYRMQALTSNIANLDTPGYQRLSVTFEETLQQARQGIRDDKNAEGVHAQVEVTDGPPQLENELMELADTQMRTQLATRAMREHFELLRTGITGRTG